MADEILKRDENHEPVIGLVTDDALKEIRMGRIDNATKALKVIMVGGTGGGNVVGPESSTIGDIAIFSDITGQLLADSGVLLSSLLTDAPSDGNTYGRKNATWSAVVAGTGDVIGPATNTADYIPQWNGANSKTLKNGIPISTFAPALGADDNYVTDAQLVVIGNTSGVNTGNQDLSGYAPIASPTFTGTPAAPTAGAGDSTTQLATTAFVQQAVRSVPSKEASEYGTTAALPTIVYNNGTAGVGATLTGVSVGALSIDGGSPTVGQRILVKNQVSTFQNGIYTVTATGSGIAVFVLTRALDFNQQGDVVTGASTYVVNGTVLGATTWDVNSADNPVIGTDAITFIQSAGPGSIIAGTGISISGVTVGIDATVATLTGTQTLTNKTFVAPILGAATATSINGILVGQGTNSITGNTAVGVGALDAANSGDGYNTAIGYQTLSTNTTGSQNTANGYQALLLNTTGSSNSAQGFGVLTYNTTGSNNTAQGVNALQSNTTGNNNVAIGYYAGYYETGSNAFYVNNIDQTSTANDKAYSLLYGTFAGTAGTTAGNALVVNGTLVVGDHGTGTTDQVVNVSYGTSATAPTASTTTEGSIYLTYTP